MDMFSKGQPGAVKRERVGRPSKRTPEKRAAYDAGQKASRRRELEEKAEKAPQPDTRFSNGVLRRRVGPK